MPEDTATPAQMETIPQPRMTILKIALVVMSILLVVGFAVVVITIAHRLSNPDETAAAKALSLGRFGVSAVHVAPGQTVKSITMNDDRIAIQVSGPAGEEIILVSPKSGQELGRIQLRPVTDLAQNQHD